jgi:hypothetical protein
MDVLGRSRKCPKQNPQGRFFLDQEEEIEVEKQAFAG